MTDKKAFRTNILIVIFCLLGSFFFLFLFWQDLNATLYRQGEEPVGTITFRFNSAKRRFINRVAWQKLRNGSELYNGDIIRTADISEATVTFSVTDSIDLYSNTLIQIFVDDKNTKIDVGGGVLSVRSSPDSDLILVSGENLIKVNSSATIQAANWMDGNLDIIVNEGTVSMGNGQLVEAGSGLRLNPAGQEIQMPFCAALSPLPGANYITFSVDPLPVNFIWNKKNYPSDGITRLEVAYDRSFKTLLYSEETKADRLVVLLPEGTFFWRLYPLLDNSSNEILYSKISVTKSTLPVPINPTGNRIIPFQYANPAVHFLWSSSPAASSYIVEAADNSLMSNPVFHSEVSAGTTDQLSISSSSMGEGVWYWRIIPVWRSEYILNKSVSELKSETASFSITSDNLPIAVVPVILFEASPVVEEPVREEPVVAPPPRPAPQTAVVQRPVERPPEPVVVAPPPAVVEKPPESEPVIVIPPVVLSLLPVPQNLLPRDSFVLRHEVPVSESIVFSWNDVEGANGYILTIYDEQDGIRSIVQVTQVLKESRYTLQDIRTLGRGTFFWQVEAVYAANNGSIERHGELFPNKLIIDVPFPTRIRAGDSGILYGNN